MAMVGNSSPAGPPQGGHEQRRHLAAGLATLAGGVVLLAAVIFGLTAGVGAIWSSVTSKPAPAQVAVAQGFTDAATTTAPASATTTAPASATTAAPSAATAPSEKHESDAAHVTVSLTIKNIKTSGGQQPAYVGPNGVGADTLFSVTAGQSVTVSVKNEDSGFHTFTVPNLGLAVTIKPLATTSFTFRPSAAGSYPWKCEIPCGGWVMDHVGYMTGTIDVAAAK